LEEVAALYLFLADSIEPVAFQTLLPRVNAPDPKTRSVARCRLLVDPLADGVATILCGLTLQDFGSA